MADEQTRMVDLAARSKAEEASPAADADEVLTEPDAEPSRRWSSLWQVPAIVISGALIGLAVYTAADRAPKNDFDGALTTVENLLSGDRFELAGQQLREVLEPNLELAEDLEQARFHAAVADWINGTQRVRGFSTEDNARRIIDHYERAKSLGLVLAPDRLERWAHAAIEADDLTTAHQRLDELEALSVARSGDAHSFNRVARVLRRMVEHIIASSPDEIDKALELLTRFASDPRTSQGDAAWAAARFAELRIQSGRPQEAVDHLLVDLRRVEQKPGRAPPGAFGELYLLLARAYYEIGDDRDARFNLEQAIKRLDAAEPRFGEALVLQGYLALADDQPEQAFDPFDRVVRDFVRTSAFRSALLGRAEVSSILGHHEEALTDYAELRTVLAGGVTSPEVTPRTVGVSIADRHDAAVATGRLDLALRYGTIAEQLFPPSQVSADILLRLAATNRALAEHLVREAMASEGAVTVADLDPRIRQESSEHYRRAADYFVRHARLLVSEIGESERWANSLWLAADSFDLAGWHDRAIEVFTEYINSRADEPRRAEAIFRLGRVHHAVMDYQAAADQYERVIAEHPRSTFASQSHVPLAQCYRVLDRPSQAERELLAVVTGQRFIGPEAVDFRDALIELGKLYYETGAYIKAIERLREAINRYPGDSRRCELLFQLADSYRNSALQIDGDLSEKPTIAPSEEARLRSQRDDQLITASELYAEVCQTCGSSGRRRLDTLRFDQLRRSWLYRGDCAFHLRRFEEAIQMYDHAAREFADHHSSMYALVQIVNCYSALGETERARSAHERAMVRLQQLPDDAFDAADALLDRTAWELWLSNNPAPPTQTATAG